MDTKRRVEIDFDCDIQPKKKCAKRCLGNHDRISDLPDETLIDILNLLSLKEAGRTSVLSSRWINLWKHIPSLNFDAQTAWDIILNQDKIHADLIESERLKYVNWVDSVVQSHKSLTLKEFIIRSGLDVRAKNSITQWLKFAFSRQVQRLEMDLNSWTSRPGCYCFPEELHCCRAPYKLPVGFKSLKELSFRYVDLSDGVIEAFLRNCPSLERLFVQLTHKISNVEVCGPSLRLKHLEIIHCSGLKSLKVSAPNLTSLRVTTRLERLFLEFVPMLVDVSINWGNSYDSVKRVLSALSCCLSQLETLCLFMISLTDQEAVGLIKFAEMPKLKKLAINYYLGKGHENLVWLTALIRASPLLEEFVLNYEWHNLPKKDREVKDTMRCPHNHLKMFKFCGYYGRSNDAELLGYIMKNCTALEKIIIDPSDALSSKSTDEYDVEITARKNAEQLLRPLVPHHVQLVVLP